MVQRGVVASWCDRILDAVVVLLATWTVVYHVCLVLRLGVVWAAPMELVLLVAAVVIAVRRSGFETGASAPSSTTVDRASSSTTGKTVLGGVTVAAAVVAAVAMALSWAWPLVWVPWWVAGVAGTAWTALRHRGRHEGTDEDAGPESGRLTPAVVLVWAVGLAGLSTWIQRGNPDDLFYVNLSQWVAAHGSFPVRDTLFADLTYPMSNWPPVASYDGLVGTVAHLLGAHAASVEYYVVPPLATALSVLALWRLLRVWRVRHTAVVLSVAMVFLLFDGTESYGPPGNLWLTRLWQGKVVLLCVLVPLVLTYAVRYVERPSRQRAFWLGIAGAACVALSTTAIFLVPVLAVAGMAPLFRRWRPALGGFAALAAYPLAAGVVTVALGGRSADDFGARRFYRFEAHWIGHEIFLTGLVALVGVAAVLLGPLLVPHPAARVTTGLLVLATGAVLIPGTTRLAFRLVGLGPTLWRLSWGLTIAALVGLLVAWLGERLVRLVRRRGEQWSRRQAALRLVAPVVLLGLLVPFGAPIWAESTGSVWRAPFHWQRSRSSLSVVHRLLELARPGDLVLAPDSVSISLAVTTTDVRSVAPRDYYMYYLRDDPSFHYRDRLTLVDFVNHTGDWHAPAVTDALRALRVGFVCVSTLDVRRFDAVRASGYTPIYASEYYRCLRAT